MNHFDITIDTIKNAYPELTVKQITPARFLFSAEGSDILLLYSEKGRLCLVDERDTKSRTVSVSMSKPPQKAAAELMRRCAQQAMSRWRAEAASRQNDRDRSARADAVVEQLHCLLRDRSLSDDSRTARRFSGSIKDVHFAVEVSTANTANLTIRWLSHEQAIDLATHLMELLQDKK